MRLKYRGSTAVEFALVLPLLLLVVDGVLEFSVVMYDKLILSNAAKMAARKGAIIAAPKLSSAEIAAVAQSYCASYVLSFGSTLPVVVQVSQAADHIYQSPLTVTVSYTYQSWLISSVLSAFSSPIELASSATQWHE